MSAETKPNYCYKKDNKLKYSNTDFENLLNTFRRDTKAASTIPFPSEYLLAQFSKLAYSETFENLPLDWELLTTARNTEYLNGYFGVSFWNPKLCQIVVAHRGTELSNFGALLTDFKLSFKWNKTNQAESAATFVHKVGEIIKNKMKDSGPKFQLSITGHSLGAWLGQMTTYTLKYFTVADDKFIEDFNYISNVHAHTVVFESPGCKGNMEQLSKHFIPSLVKRKFGNFYTLDMTVFLSELNFINCINKHVGAVYKIKSTTHSMADILQQFDPCTGKIEREMVLDSKSGLLASLKSFLKPVTKIRFKTAEENANQCSLNVFDETENDFIKDWIYIRDFHTNSIYNVKDSLPYFEVDYEYDLIKGDDIIKTIASIKNYKFSKMFVSNVLSASVIFKMRTDQFKNSLIQYCNDYYVKDKHGIQNFLSTNKQILNILVKCDLPDGYRLETSILNNICSFYNAEDPKDKHFKLEKYYFINWNSLNTILKGHSTMFENMDIKLLILECCNLIEEDFELVKIFLENANFKIVILTNDNFVFPKSIEKSIMQVDGFGHNITFEDLVENSQERLLEQKIIVLNNKKIKLKSFLNSRSNTSICSYLNSALPSNLLLHLLTAPDGEPLIIDTSYWNNLNGITIELFQEINLDKSRLESLENSVMFIGKTCNDKVNSQVSTANDDFRRECLEHLNKRSKKILYLCEEKDNKIFLHKIFRKDLYIRRNIIHARFVSSSIFKDKNPDQLYYICGKKEIFDKISSTLDLEKYIFLTEEQAKLKLQETNLFVHVLKLEDKNTIRWLASRGNIQYLKRYLKEHVAEEDLVNEDIVILSGEGGTGKSSYIKMLCLFLQSNCWTFALQLSNANFNNFVLNHNNIAKFILNTCGITGDYVQFLLSVGLRYAITIPIYLMFDGFEQIPNKESRKTFLEIINVLKDCPNVKILITTRPFACKELENGISVPASYFSRTDLETDIINYLTTFWLSRLEVLEEQIDSTKLRVFAEKILKTASSFFGETISTFLGVPLHIRMIAEIFAPNANDFNFETAFSDFLMPYEKLIETHCNVYFKRNNFPENEFLKNTVMDGIYQKMYTLAIMQLFRLDAEFKTENTVQELNKIGLIQPSESYLNFSFMHDSVRDYFISKFLGLWLEGKLVCCEWEIDTFLLRFFLLKRQHKEVRFFLNCHLKEVIVSTYTLNTCRVRLKQLFVEDERFLFNEHETFYHICIKEDLEFLLKNFLIDLLEDDYISRALLSKANLELKTALYLLIEDKNIEDNSLLRDILKKINGLPIECTKHILSSTFFRHFAKVDQLLEIINLSKVYEVVRSVLLAIQTPFTQIKDFLTACRRSKSKDFIKILRACGDDIIKRYLVSITNEFVQTGLHLTISETIILEMLKLGVDINSQDYHGLTPLLRAIKGGRTKTALFLIKEGANLNLSDNFNNSPLIHAAKHGNEEIIQILLDSDQVDIKACNRFGTTALMLGARNGNKNIVRWLLERRVSVNSIDQTGLSGLYHCIKSNQIHLVKLFVRYGADINIQDVYGVTPFLDSVKKSNWNAVNTLLDNGADPFIESYYHSNPLKILVEKGKTNVLKKILTKTLGELTSASINNFSSLTEDDKSYINRYILK